MLRPLVMLGSNSEPKLQAGIATQRIDRQKSEGSGRRTPAATSVDDRRVAYQDELPLRHVQAIRSVFAEPAKLSPCQTQ